MKIFHQELFIGFEKFVLNLHYLGAGVGLAVGFQKVMVEFDESVSPFVAIHQIDSLLFKTCNVEGCAYRLDC